MKPKESPFKAYDIRGMVPQQLNELFFTRLGFAIEAWLLNKFNLKSPKIGVLHDMRPDSERFAKNLLAGTKSAQCTYFGMLPTDASYFALNKEKLDLVCVITASHNPGNYNGAKLFRRDFETNSYLPVPITITSGLVEIEKFLNKGPMPTVKEDSHTLVNKNILDAYAKYILGFFEISPVHKLNIGIDYGNGVTGIINKYLQKAPIDIHSLYENPDGSFPNHLANPALPETLKDLQHIVISKKLDIGLAFDGDGDRLGIVDDKGCVLDGNQAGIILVNRLLPTLKNKTVVLAITSSKNLENVILELGGNVVYAKQGRFVPEKMKEIGASIGLEPSCHYYLSCNFGLDSGLVSAAIILSWLSGEKKKLSELTTSSKVWLSSGELNFAVTDTNKVLETISEQFKDNKINRLDGIRIDADSFWISVRSSNTEPLVRLNIESTTKEELERLLGFVRNIIGQYEQ